MKQTKVKFRKKFILPLILGTFLLFVGLIPLGGLTTLQLFGTLHSNNWVEYRDENLGISYIYPTEPLPNYKWTVTSQGWTPIQCSSNQLALVGDEHQSKGIAICKSNKEEISNILKYSTLEKDTFALNGINYTALKTALEEKEGYILGRIVILEDQNLIIGVTKPPLGDNFKWTDHLTEKIKLRIIESIKPL